MRSANAASYAAPRIKLARKSGKSRKRRANGAATGGIPGECYQQGADAPTGPTGLRWTSPRRRMENGGPLDSSGVRHRPILAGRHSEERSEERRVGKECRSR